MNAPAQSLAPVLRRATVLAALVVASGCAHLAFWSRPPKIITFTDKVWRVERGSDIPPGALYVFLNDGTLFIKAPEQEPLVGTWNIEAGTFTMVEGGVAYQVDVLSLRPDEFLIRSRSPGPPVSIRLVPADAPPSHQAE